MKKPVRSMINGSAIALTGIAIILLILLMSRRCESDKSHTTPSPSIIIETDTTASDTLTAGKRTEKSKDRQKRSRRSNKSTPKIYPERSPLDEPAGR